MKNLIMFSSPFISPQIVNHINNMVNSKKLAVYIPAGMEFGEFSGKFYKNLGFSEAERFSIAYDFDKSKIERLLEADMIHIGGGNTFLLLYLLKLHGLLPTLKKYVEDGGVLIGNSAGSIVMCEDIQIANVADDNITGSDDYSSLGLVDFEIKPHFDGYMNQLNWFKLYSQVKNKTVYGIHEDDAIIIKNDKIITIGNPYKIENGIIK